MNTGFCSFDYQPPIVKLDTAPIKLVNEAFETKIQEFTMPKTDTPIRVDTTTKPSIPNNSNYVSIETSSATFALSDDYTNPPSSKSGDSNVGEVSLLDSTLETLGYIQAAVDILTNITSLVSTIMIAEEKRKIMDLEIEAVKQQIDLTRESFQRQKDELARAKRVFDRVNKMFSQVQQLQTTY